MGKKADRLTGESLLKRKEKYTRMARKCSSFLKERYNIKRVYIIGSLVNGFFHDRSDIDPAGGILYQSINRAV
jgi:hypothetical protein